MTEKDEIYIFFISWTFYFELRFEDHKNMVENMIENMVENK